MIFCTFLCCHHTTSTLIRWLDRVSHGQYLPSLIINCVAINKDSEKLPPQLYYIEMKICCDQGYDVIGVVIPTNDVFVYFTCSRISRHWGLFFENHSRDLFLPKAASTFVTFKKNLCERYRHILG